jgi:hypothetical protein
MKILKIKLTFLLHKKVIVNSSFSNVNTIETINDCVLEIDYFEPTLNLDSTALASLSANLANHSPSKSPNFSDQPNSDHSPTSITDADLKLLANGLSSTSDIYPEQHSNHTNLTLKQKQFIKTARILRSNEEFKSFLYVYPKYLKYDTQKTYAKARNIMVKVEFRDKDLAVDDPNSPLSQCLKCIFKSNSNATKLSEPDLFCSSYSTSVTYHNKNPQFYDEIKILLPLNMTEKHHVLFKFYHVSCANAKSTTFTESDLATPLVDMDSTDHSILGALNSNSANETTVTVQAGSANSSATAKSIETLIGYAWLPVFKSGRLLSGEKALPIAQSLSNNYLSIEQIGMGQMIGPSDVKWVEYMKPLFKVNLLPSSTVHTIVIKYFFLNK